jgi:hypothetical protein
MPLQTSGDSQLRSRIYFAAAAGFEAAAFENDRM